jgi:hypothetical protein
MYPVHSSYKTKLFMYSRHKSAFIFYCCPNDTKRYLTFSGTLLWVIPSSTRRQDITYTYRDINKHYFDDDFFEKHKASRNK